MHLTGDMRSVRTGRFVSTPPCRSVGKRVTVLDGLHVLARSLSGHFHRWDLHGSH